MEVDSWSELMSFVRGNDENMVRQCLQGMQNQDMVAEGGSNLKEFLERRDQSTGQTVFHVAAELGHVEVVRTLMSYDHDLLNLHDGASLTPILIAMAKQHREVVLLLLQQGADVNGIIPSSQQTLLHIACIQQDLEIVDALLSVPTINLDIMDRRGLTPLMQAVANYECLQLFLKHPNVNVNFLNRSNISALMLAVSMGHQDCAEILVGAGANVNQLDGRGHSLLHVCTAAIISPSAVNGAALHQLLRYLLDHGASESINVMESSNGMTPLMLAAVAGCLELVELFLSHGAKISSVSTATGHNAFSLACCRGSLPVVKLFLERFCCRNCGSVDNDDSQCNDDSERQERININEVIGPNHYTPLLHATAHKQASVVKELLRFGADVYSRDGKGSTALMIASTMGEVEIVGLLQRHIIDMEFKVDGMNCPAKAATQNIEQFVCEIDDEGYTALHYAACGGHCEIVRLLLQHGRKCINLTAKDLMSPLLLATSSKSLEVVQLLVENGADICYQNPKNGLTALMVACNSGQATIVKFLVDWCRRQSSSHIDATDDDNSPEHGVYLQDLLSLEAVDKNGYTALLWAASSGSVEIIQLLIDIGANTKAREKTGYSAAELATVLGHSDIVSMLLSGTGSFSERLKKINFTGSIPDHFKCPISLEIMNDPITVCNGVTYDRASLERYFTTSNERRLQRLQELQRLGQQLNISLPAGVHTVGLHELPCPLTRTKIRKIDLLNGTSRIIKQLIEQFVSQQENEAEQQPLFNT